MKVKTLTLQSPLFPESLKHIASQPAHLQYVGNIEGLLAKPRLAIVGSRKVSAYGKSITLKLAREAAERGIVIVSGLALGVDGIAHQGALEAGGLTIAVLPSGLDKVYPAAHRDLAERILQRGGVLITEYPFNTAPYKTNFLARNRIISGLSEAVLITEAATRSGSLNTASHALEQGRTVMAVPGNITSELSAGTNNLIKAGAVPVTEIRDILAVMGLTQNTTTAVPMGATEAENTILRLMASGTSDAGQLLHDSALAPPIFNQTLTMLEITGKIRPLGAGHWGIN